MEVTKKLINFEPILKLDLRGMNRGFDKKNHESLLNCWSKLLDGWCHLLRLGEVGGAATKNSVLDSELWAFSSLVEGSHWQLEQESERLEMILKFQSDLSAT